MKIEALKCPNCGALLPPASRSLSTCGFCGASLVGVPIDDAPQPLRPLPPSQAETRWGDSARPRVLIDGQRYLLLGALARGECSDVLLGRRDALLTEMVVIKALRSSADADLLEREWGLIEDLNESRAQGFDYFARLIPQPVVRGPLKARDGRPPRPAAVYRWRSGFQHTLDDVRQAYPGGVDPRAAVWMWKRLLELLGWVHRSGFVHGALLPRHVLIHPRDHGVTLVGWSCGMPRGGREPLPALCEGAQAFYPEALWSGAPPSVESDLTMSARALIHALGGDPWRRSLPSSTPEPLAELLRRYAAETPESFRSEDAWELKEELDLAARQAFGPPRYHKFLMPGWG